MVDNSGNDDDLETLGDLFIDPITGEAQTPSEQVLEEEEENNPATADASSLSPLPPPSIPDTDTKITQTLLDASVNAYAENLPTTILHDALESKTTLQPFSTTEELDSAKKVMAEEAAAVDGILETAVLASDTMLEDERREKNTSTTEDPQASFFQISIRNVSSDSIKLRILRVAERESLASDLKILKKRLDDLGGYRFSHLREYQATVLMQELQQFNVECRLDLPVFGGPSDFPEHPTASFFHQKENEVESTGAQAVELPKNSKEVLLSTLDQISGHEVLEEKGILSAHSSVARTFFRSDEQEIRLSQKIDHLQPNSEQGKEPHLPRAEMDNVFEKLLKRIQREAMRRGANAVIGIQISGFPEASAIDPEADQIHLIASGTAVILRSQIEQDSYNTL